MPMIIGSDRLVRSGTKWLGALTYDTSLGGFQTNITEQQLRDVPEFSEDFVAGSRLGNAHPPVLPSYWESRGGLIR